MTERKRKTSQEKLVSTAQVIVPKTAMQFAKLTGLLKFNPTPAQKKQIVDTVRTQFEQFEQAYTAPEKVTTPGSFTLAS